MADPTREELKEYLQEAGLYEDNLSHSELLNYYNVIKNSKSTAQEEQERRDINDSVESMADDKTIDLDISSDIHMDDDIGDCVSDSNSSSVGASPKLNKKLVTSKNKTKLSLTKSEQLLVPQLESDLDKEKDGDSNILNLNDKHKPLDIIFYERKYDLPPYCNPKYNNLTISQRAQIICNFHKNILGKFYELHCNSINPAPWGKPIAANDKFNNFEQKGQSYDNSFEFVHLNEEEHSNDLQVYISRSGRQTKRKVYVDDEEDDNESKKTKKVEDKPYEAEKKSATKRQYINKLNNVDIMKRSKLFADSPRKAEKLFDQLKKEEDLSITNKNNEINLSNDDDDDDVIPNSQSSDVQPDFNPIRRRIIPPRGRRGIGPRKLKGADTIKSNSNTSPSTNNTSTVSNTPSAAASSAENKKNSMAGKTKCPICSEFFSQNDIEAHASSCGLLVEPETTLDTSLRNGNLAKIKCSVCDTEMIMNTEYEVHVAECIKRSKQSENA